MFRWVALFWISLCVAELSFAGTTTDLLPGYRLLDGHQEQIRTITFVDSVRCVIDAPLERCPHRTLVIYATPNGNTLEQTWGCQSQPDRDWHFDIQHVAAQVRELRNWSSTQLSTKHELWLAVIQAPQLSWPEYRARHADSQEKIVGMIEFLLSQAQFDETILAAHSGGGAFILDRLQAQRPLPDNLKQILFLDANYSYDDTLHADKLIHWLQSSPGHSLSVLAYDDRAVTLNGRKVVSDSGGTFRATERMQRHMARDFEFTEQRLEDFNFHSALQGQISFAVHQNPANKILHTALVGEMNGLQAAIKQHWIRNQQLQTPSDSPTSTSSRNLAWPGLTPQRNYNDRIAADPITRGAFARPAKDSTNVQLTLPPRDENSLTGSAFAQLLQSTPADKVQSLIMAELTKGNLPDRCRQMKGIKVEMLDTSMQVHTGRYYVTTDYLAIGSDDDYFRIPMQPATAWALAQATDSSMITAKMADDIHTCARWPLKPQPLTENRESAQTFWQHQQLIQQQLLAQPRGQVADANDHDSWAGIISGIKKDLVLTGRLLARPKRVALYGWHSVDGVPIQPLYVGHVDHYVDYSHGVRLMHNQMWVDGQMRLVNDVLSDPTLSTLLSSEGPLQPSQIASSSQWLTE